MASQERMASLPTEVSSSARAPRTRWVTHRSSEPWRNATSAAIPVFCFPNGDYASFTDRERQTVRSIGMRACVLSEPGFITASYMRSNGSTAIPELPRFAYADDTPRFRQIVGGMERLQRALRVN